MKKTDAFRFFPANFVEATYTWPPEAVGIYIRLLCWQWNNGPLTDDVQRLVRIANCTGEQFLHCWSEYVREKFVQTDDGRWINPRLERERPKVTRDNKVRRKPIQKTYTDEFERFWNAFPPGRKTAKGKAWEAWQKAILGVSADTLIAAAAEYAQSDVGRAGKDGFVKMPSSWLNQRCWEDDRDAWRLNRDAGDRNELDLNW